MCGRFALWSPEEVLAMMFGIPMPNLRPRYNIAPSQDVLTLFHDEETGRRAEPFRWGLVPFWARDPKMGSRMINARSETVAEKPAFRAAFRHRRCLVPADGFFEWERSGKQKKPHFFAMKDRSPFAIAGLWEHWSGEDGEEIWSVALLTTEANAVLAAIHDRMPVILHRENYERWVDPENRRRRDLLPLLAPFDPDAMTRFPVTMQMNSPHFQDAAAVHPLQDASRP